LDQHTSQWSKPTKENAKMTSSNVLPFPRSHINDNLPEIVAFLQSGGRIKWPGLPYDLVWDNGPSYEPALRSLHGDVSDYPGSRNPVDLLNQNGITLKCYTPGKYRSICPRCSASRSTPDNRREECLSVLVEIDSACWNCFNCGWTGPEKGNGAGNENGRKPWPSYPYAGGALRKVKKPKGRKGAPYFWQHRNDKQPALSDRGSA
jgi:hypothetical protein